MKDLKELNRWKKYNVKVRFKELKKKGNKRDFQMLVFFNDELVYATRSNSFNFVEETREKPLGMIAFFKGKRTPDTYVKRYLQWDEKAKKRFDNWTTNFRICRDIQNTYYEKKKQFEELIFSEQ